MSKKIVMRGLKLTSISILLIALETISATIVHVTLAGAGLPRNINITFTAVMLIILSLLCLRVVPTHFLDLKTDNKDTLWKTSLDLIISLTNRVSKIHTGGNKQYGIDEKFESLVERICESEKALEEIMDEQRELIETLASSMAKTSTLQIEENKRTLPPKDLEKELSCTYS